LRVDVRLQIETHDAAFLYVQYTGLLEMNTAVQEATSAGRGTQFDDQYFFINPRMETGDARYAWVNTTFFVGEGRMLPGSGVEYRVWRPSRERRRIPQTVVYGAARAALATVNSRIP